MKKKITNSLLSNISPTDKPIEVYDTELKGFTLRIQPSGTKSFQVRYRYDGKQTRKTIGTYPAFKAPKARREAERILSELKLGTNPSCEKPAADLTLREFIDGNKGKYGVWSTANHKDGKATLSRLCSAFAQLLDVKMSNISVWQLEEWRSARIKKGIKASTINRDLTALKSVFSKSVEWGFLGESPAKKIKLSKVDTIGRVRFLYKDEEKALRDALDDREEQLRVKRDKYNKWCKQRGLKTYPDLRKLPFTDHLKPMVILSINTGIRRGELFNLTCRDVDFKKRVLTIIGESAKSGTTRRVNLNDEAISTLEKWISQIGSSILVFPNKDGRPFDNVNTSWKGLLSNAKITDFRWHDLRHHFASKLVMRGVDLNTVRELLGHSDIKMTIRYAHLAEEHKADAVARLLG